jgi:hypothetical protein
VVKQDNAGPNWTMVLPVVMSFEGFPSTVVPTTPSGAVHACMPSSDSSVLGWSVR